MSSIRTCNEQVASLSFDAYNARLPRYFPPSPPPPSLPVSSSWSNAEWQRILSINKGERKKKRKRRKKERESCLQIRNHLR